MVRRPGKGSFEKGDVEDGGVESDGLQQIDLQIHRIIEVGLSPITLQLGQVLRN